MKADFFFAGVPSIEDKIEQEIRNTKVASAKVAFDTVRILGGLSLGSRTEKAIASMPFCWGISLPKSGSEWCWVRSRVEKRPARYRDPKPRNPKILEKNSKITSRAPTPNSLKRNSIFGAFLVFLSFFEEFGVGARGVVFECFSRIFGFRGFGSL